MKTLIPLAIGLLAFGLTPVLAAPAQDFGVLEKEYEQKILPLLERYCLDCHDKATTEGELDLERFEHFRMVRADPKTWQDIVYQLETGEMPPKKKKKVAQPSAEERAALIAWSKRYLDTEARAQAGDPGPVILRRLSNAEYTYTIRDLTGVPTLDPAHEFPVDSAAGEGFTNAGGALVMSPALFEKYLEAGKEVAQHAVLLPSGIRFSPSTSRADHANEILTELRAFYLKTTGGDGINFKYTSQVRPAAPEGVGEGRLDLTPYLAALISKRETLQNSSARAGAIAAEHGLNPKYLTILSGALVTGEPQGSILLDNLRTRIAQAKPDDARAITAEIRSWQDQLWKFNNVGHFGLTRPWQEPVSKVATSQDLRIKLGPETKDLYLSAQSFGTGKAVVEWQQPRIERPGKKPILLQSLESGYRGLQLLREKSLKSTANYLAAAAEVRKQGEKADLSLIAAPALDPDLLRAWVSYLGIHHQGSVAIKEHLTSPIPSGAGRNFINGWTLKGVADYSILGNSSDDAVRIPGDHQAHKVVCHPRPERWIAAGWMSPLDGRVKIAPHVRDAHNNCGNGVVWSVNLRRGSLTRTLRSANLDLGKTATIEPVLELEVRSGDLISIIIGARDNNHGCDLTEIDLAIDELDAKKRKWSLSGDCADDMLAGNPHPDRLGNLGVWHFYGGMNDDRNRESEVIPGSLIEPWISEKDATRQAALALEVQSLLSNPLPANAPEADKALHSQLSSLTGPLFGRLDFSALALRGATDDVNLDDQEGRFQSNGNLQAAAPSHLHFQLPPALVAGAEFVVRGVVHDSSDPGVAFQISATTTKPNPSQTLAPNQAVLSHPSEAARTALSTAFDEFRNLFPAAMCYARIIPADEVVTLLLYHREDEHLKRLMLTKAGQAKLDQLWEQLRFVKQEPHRLVTAYEQLWQFATQDSDPTKFEPMEAAIRKRSADFEQALLSAQPAHLNALIEFAPQVYRRPLKAPEAKNLRSLYQQLCNENLSHEQAFQLTLARLFSSAAFLYKSEKPSPQPKQGPVDDWELATRLSYFLTSSAPDAELTRTAQDRTLRNPAILAEQADRLLKETTARRLAIHFACQWLHIREFDQFDEKNEKLYPEFESLREKMYEESVRFFADFSQNDRSILSLLNADYTFADAELAKFYNLPQPVDGWQRIDKVRMAGRGGILALSTTLAKQSGASRTSPILRGNWISETLLGEKLPKPPKGVPPLPEELPKGLSARELISKHSSDAACAKCHDRIDPYGFALEAYDTIGRFRADMDTAAKLPDGTSINGLDGLRNYLLTDRRDTFVRHFCQKLFGYALGREVQLSDQPFLDQLMSKLEKSDYRIGVAVEEIVSSPQFREIRSAIQN